MTSDDTDCSTYSQAFTHSNQLPRGKRIARSHLPLGRLHRATDALP